jgi:curved DNA-binding protein CbpA
MKNYYQILGINPDTDQSKIKAAAQAKADEINEAFRVLNDPEKRKAYDLTLSPIIKPEITPSTSKPPEFKVAGENQQRFISMLSSWGEYLRIETPSLRDVMIFMVALVFFMYMLVQFMFPPPITAPSQPALSLGNYPTSNKN